MSPLENLGINPGFLLIQVIAFIVLYVLMTRFIFSPLVNMLKRTAQSHRQGFGRCGGGSAGKGKRRSGSGKHPGASACRSAEGDR